jgi:hypothetical protein
MFKGFNVKNPFEGELDKLTMFLMLSHAMLGK